MRTIHVPAWTEPATQQSAEVRSGRGAWLARRDQWPHDSGDAHGAHGVASAARAARWPLWAGRRFARTARESGAFAIAAAKAYFRALSS